MLTSKATLMREQFTGSSVSLLLFVEMRDNHTVIHELETYARNHCDDMNCAEESFAAWELVNFDGLLNYAHKASVVLALLPYQDGQPMSECMRIVRHRTHTNNKLRYAVE